MSDGVGMNGGNGQQPGQGYPQYQQQYPGYGPPAGGPDWDAMAQRAQDDAKRKTRMRLLLGVVALAVVGGLVAVAVSVSKGGDPVAQPTGTASTGKTGSSVSPTATTGATKAPVPNPASPLAGDDASLKAIWDVSTDKAPVDPAAFFPEETLEFGGAVWTRRSATTVTPCWHAITGGLADAIENQACRQVVRATYVLNDSAVVVGVAVFDKRLQAETATGNVNGQLKGLQVEGMKDFCQEVGCASTHGSLGRFAYFTAAGSAKEGGITADKVATDAGPGFAARVRSTLEKRALSQAG
ncbi:hypothetical protein ACIA8O_29955 [Kitasatospora sp. NPDC051853]|uniref:hypothetical protein n=1 Tax=Kitasatospora sp. NPDC051853 TaxID=3364058 RepID=UPI00379B3A07